MMWVMSYYKALCHPERSEGSQKGATETITTLRADASTTLSMTSALTPPTSLRPIALRVLFLIPVMFREGMMWVMSYYKALCHPERSEGSQKGATETITTLQADASTTLSMTSALTPPLVILSGALAQSKDPEETTGRIIQSAVMGSLGRVGRALTDNYPYVLYGKKLTHKINNYETRTTSPLSVRSSRTS